MKTPRTAFHTSLTLGAFAIGLYADHSDIRSLVDAMPLHAGMDYHRYLLEQDDIGDELKAWTTKWNATAHKNGWVPKAKNANATPKDIEEDHKQRFFLAKQLVERLKTQNPQAEFSTDSPFTLLTTDEFAAYTKNSFIAGSAGAASRRLREAEPAPLASTPKPLALQLQRLLTAVKSFALSYASSTTSNPPLLRNSGNSADAKESTPATTRPTPTMATPATTRNTKTVPAATRPSITPTVSPTPTPTPTTVAPTPPAITTTPTLTPAPTPTTASPSVDWSAGKCMPAVQNQGQCGSCWAFASVATVEIAQCLSQGGTSLTKLSEQTLTSCDTRNAGCNGGVPQYAMQYIQQNGLCTLADDPYTAGSGVLTACNTACTKVKTGMRGVQALTQSEPALLSALSLRPVVIALQAGNDAWKQYKSGVLTACPSATASIDHAVVAVGFDATTIKIRNSWGASWGEAGYIRLARSTAGLGTCKMFQQMTAATF